MNQDVAHDFILHGEPNDSINSLAHGLTDVLIAHGYKYEPNSHAPGLVLNFIKQEKPAAYRRRSQATFVISLIELHVEPDDPIRVLYPYLVRSLSNMLLVYIPKKKKIHFLTLDLGHYVEFDGDEFFKRIFLRIHPMASSTLIVNNRFEPDLPPELWEGDELTRSLSEAGKNLSELDLLPAPFPIHEILTAKDLYHVNRLYGIGGLSYGNLSVRKDRKRFWMSASGVDKGNLKEIGRDILLVKDYDPSGQAIVVSVPPGKEVRRVSVDAIEHWMIYHEHPAVEAIIHIHAWMDGVPSTLFHFPCGSKQLAEAVAEKVRTSTDYPTTVVGLRNHGLTITGRSLADIFERIEGRIIRTVPMT